MFLESDAKPRLIDVSDFSCTFLNCHSGSRKRSFNTLPDSRAMRVIYMYMYVNFGPTFIMCLAKGLIFILALSVCQCGADIGAPSQSPLSQGVHRDPKPPIDRPTPTRTPAASDTTPTTPTAVTASPERQESPVSPPGPGDEPPPGLLLSVWNAVIQVYESIMGAIMHVLGYLFTPRVMFGHAVAGGLLYALRYQKAGILDIMRVAVLEAILSYLLWLLIPNSLGTVLFLFVCLLLYQRVLGPRVQIRKGAQLLASEYPHYLYLNTNS